ncbi:MAG: HNH endonuclease [Chloroflexi bacterium]|nr:HNH endonuclease [Chloroflexota bacterium]
MSLVNAPVLVLNQNYEPLNVCNARRAFVLLERGKAEVVKDGERALRSVARAFHIPSVIRMVYYIKRPRPAARLSRREVFARDGFTCQYCGRHSRDLTLDHVVPRHRNGPHTWENLVSACKPCNHRKAGRTPEEARMRLIRAPRRPRATLATIFWRHIERHPGWRPFFPGAEHEHARRADVAASPVGSGAGLQRLAAAAE